MCYLSVVLTHLANSIGSYGLKTPEPWRSEKILNRLTEVDVALNWLSEQSPCLIHLFIGRIDINVLRSRTISSYGQRRILRLLRMGIAKIRIQGCITVGRVGLDAKTGGGGAIRGGYGPTPSKKVARGPLPWSNILPLANRDLAWFGRTGAVQWTRRTSLTGQPSSIHRSATIGNACAALPPGRRTQGVEYLTPSVGH